MQNNKTHPRFNFGNTLATAKSKHSQVWVETAVYTLIGLAIIAVLLTVVTPQIKKAKDKSVLEQTIIALESINSKVIETEQASGSIRIINLKVAKGFLKIDPQDDSLIYTLEDTKLEFSEAGEEIQEGSIKIKTEKFGSNFKTTLILDYDSIDITFDNQIASKILQAGSVPYKIRIENVGDHGMDEMVHVDFNII